MTEIIIDLSDLARAPKLASVLSNINADFDARGSHYLVNAKSIMGLFSLDLSNPIRLICHTDKPEILDFVKMELKEIGAIK